MIYYLRLYRLLGSLTLSHSFHLPIPPDKQTDAIRRNGIIAFAGKDIGHWIASPSRGNFRNVLNI